MRDSFDDLSTPPIADACLPVRVPLRAAHRRASTDWWPGSASRGRALPVRHYGSVDVFLEAFGAARPGDVLVIDNAGRTDEACIGDLAVLEAQAAGVSGIVVWGLHRVSGSLGYGTRVPVSPALAPYRWRYRGMTVHMGRARPAGLSPPAGAGEVLLATRLGSRA